MKRMKEVVITPKIFTDLVSKPTEFDQTSRTLIDQYVKKASSLEQFISRWNSLTLELSDGAVITGGIDVSDGSSTSSQTNPRYLCRLHLQFNGQSALNLHFWARPNPSLFQENYDSPIRLYNTKVQVLKVDGFMPFKYYDAIMYLLRNLLPEQTKLLLYVRQRDSREMLDNGADPRTVPLSQVFQKAGWTFLRYHDDKITKDPLRRHKLIVST